MMANFQPPNTRGKLEFNVSLARYNTWGVGGEAECVFRPIDIEDLSQFLATIDSQVPVTWLGLGSNVLIRDGGISGVVIITQGCLNQFEFKEHGVVSAQAGVPCAKLARATAGKQLTGIEFMAGIPGTVGGALAMNAGAFGGQTWDYVTSVQAINRAGEIRTRLPSEYQIAYRTVTSPEPEWFVSAQFKLQERTGKIVSIKELLQQRADTQPIGKKNCGSVFKNPPGHHAAKLIEQCHLKGHAIGGARISSKHANFIINDADASAADIEKLISYTKNTVLERCGIELMPEVKILGNAKTI